MFLKLLMAAPFSIQPCYLDCLNSLGKSWLIHSKMITGECVPSSVNERERNEYFIMYSKERKKEDESSERKKARADALLYTFPFHSIHSTQYCQLICSSSKMKTVQHDWRF